LKAAFTEPNPEIYIELYDEDTPLSSIFSSISITVANEVSSFDVNNVASFSLPPSAPNHPYPFFISATTYTGYASVNGEPVSLDLGSGQLQVSQDYNGEAIVIEVPPGLGNAISYCLSQTLPDTFTLASSCVNQYIGEFTIAQAWLNINNSRYSVLELYDDVLEILHDLADHTLLNNVINGITIESSDWTSVIGIYYDLGEEE
jgi:hypothetical protein